MLFECSIQHSLYNTTITGTERVRSFLKEGELFIHRELRKISLHCWEFSLENLLFSMTVFFVLGALAFSVLILKSEHFRWNTASSG